MHHYWTWCLNEQNRELLGTVLSTHNVWYCWCRTWDNIIYNAVKSEVVMFKYSFIFTEMYRLHDFYWRWLIFIYINLSKLFLFYVGWVMGTDCMKWWMVRWCTIYSFSDTVLYCADGVLFHLLMIDMYITIRCYIVLLSADTMKFM